MDITKTFPIYFLQAMLSEELKSKLTINHNAILEAMQFIKQMHCTIICDLFVLFCNLFLSSLALVLFVCLFVYMFVCFLFVFLFFFFVEVVIKVLAVSRIYLTLLFMQSVPELLQKHLKCFLS